MFNYFESDLPDRLYAHAQYMSKIRADIEGGMFDGMPELRSLFDDHTPVGLDAWRSVVVPPSYDYHDGPAVLILAPDEPDTIFTGSIINQARKNLQSAQIREDSPQSVYRELVIPSFVGATVSTHTFKSQESSGLSEFETAPVVMVVRQQGTDTSIFGHEIDHWELFRDQDKSRLRANVRMDSAELSRAEKRAYSKTYTMLANLDSLTLLPDPTEIAELFTDDPSELDFHKLRNEIFERIPLESGLRIHAVTVCALAIAERYGEAGSTDVTRDEVAAFKAFEIID